MKSAPNARPIAAATRVAQLKSLRAAQSADRSTRPPSSGSAGRRLKTSSARLM